MRELFETGPAEAVRLIRSGWMKGLKIHNQELSKKWMSIAVEGEVDLATVEGLELAIDAIHDQHTEGLVVDLTSSSFMDSTGLKALVMAHRRFSAADRPFAIAVSGGPVSRLLDLSGVNTTIHTVASVEDLLEED